jgi:hypothetical protein
MQVFDWNSVQKAELVGEFRVEEKKILEILSSATGEKTEIQRVILNNDKRVVGNDKQECVVSMAVYVLDREEVRLLTQSVP